LSSAGFVGLLYPPSKNAYNTLNYGAFKSKDNLANGVFPDVPRLRIRVFPLGIFFLLTVSEPIINNVFIKLLQTAINNYISILF
jgi:hypothetical protein